MKPTWNQCLKLARTIDDHYSMVEAQQKTLYELSLTLEKRSVIMELGTCHGKTSAVLAYVAKHQDLDFHGIDDFSLEGNEAEVRASLDAIKVPYTLHVGKTHMVPWDKDLDLLIIDAGHDEVNVRADCKRWLSFVKPGGYAAFHDYHEPFNRKSPHWAVRYYADLYTPGWTTAKFVPDVKGGNHGLCIKQKPS